MKREEVGELVRRLRNISQADDANDSDIERDTLAAADALGRLSAPVADDAEFERFADRQRTMGQLIDTDAAFASLALLLSVRSLYKRYGLQSDSAISSLRTALSRALEENAEKDVEIARLQAWSDEDVRDDFSETEEALHPMRTSRHDLFSRAMELVHNRRSKFALVECINAVLAQKDAAESSLAAKDAEIAALRTRLEIPEPPFEHIDGIECRDETIRLHDIGVAEMKIEITALRECVKAADTMRGNGDGHYKLAYDAARAKVPL